MARRITRRGLLRGAAASGVCASLPVRAALAAVGTQLEPLREFSYEQVAVRGTLQTAQRKNVLQVLMNLDEDSLLYPFRAMSATSSQSQQERPADGMGRPTGDGFAPPAGTLQSSAIPGKSLGGWYLWVPEYDYHHDAAGLAPGHCFGQWTSALARFYASSKFDDGGSEDALKAKALRLNCLLAAVVGPGYFEKTLFPGYSFDKLLCGLMDSHRLLGDEDAFQTLNHLADAAMPALPGHAIDREIQWKVGAGIEHMWDENYTMPENLFLVSQMGAGERYRRMAEAYLLDETYFRPLAAGKNVLSDRHAYSYVNALCSAMQAYLVGGSTMHLEAARNGFAMLQEQSFATGGWGPTELLRKPGYDELITALTTTHNGFETPCGSYAHMKLTRYLLRVTRDGRYGDSMERVMFNTVLGALPLQSDGRAFYHQDLSYTAKKVYSTSIWPCCAGSLPQVISDYGINTYLHEPEGIWVNLYQPSSVRWTQGNRLVTLHQDGPYLEEGKVQIRIAASEPTLFNLHLRIPAWASDVSPIGRVVARLNRREQMFPVEAGFAMLRRVWKEGDLLELDFPMKLRLKKLPRNGAPEHAGIVALMRGPLVLFALRDPSDSGPMSLARNAVLNAQRTGDLEWTVTDGAVSTRFVPFTEIADQTYTTYFHLV